MNQPIESILIPTDGSEAAETGERRGVDLAAALGADLHVLSVVDTGDTDPPLSELDANQRTEHEQLLEGRAEQAVSTVAQLGAAHLSGRITTAVERGVPFRTITDYVDSHDIDLVVMGTHGRSGLERALLGSVAERTLRTSSVPVIAVPPSAQIVEVADVAYDDILVPTDGSPGAEVAVDWGLTLANRYDATVHTVYSVDTTWFQSDPGMAAIHDQLEETGRAALETVTERAREADVAVTASLGSGPAGRVIRSYIDEHEIDMVVMGTRGRTGVGRFLLGSVTESVLRKADLPVCCVPMRES